MRAIGAKRALDLDLDMAFPSILKLLDEEIPFSHERQTALRNRQTAISGPWSRIFLFLMLLSTNGRLEDEVLAEFLKLSISCGFLQNLKRILSVKAPTLKLFSVALLSPALSICTEEGLDFGRYLLRLGVNPNSVYCSRPPLWKAVHSKNKPAVQLLLDSGADWVTSFPSLQHHILTQMELPESESFAEALIEMRHDIAWDTNANRGVIPRSSLVLAVRARNRQLVRYLLEEGADPNFVHPRDLSALHVAVGYEDSAMVDLLISFGAGLDILCQVKTIHMLELNLPELFELREFYCPFLITPLQQAVRDGQLSMVRHLLKAGANPNGTINLEILERSEKPCYEIDLALSPLQIASRRSTYEMVEMLLKAGAKVDARHTMQSTALQYACGRCVEYRMKIAKLLLVWGADANASPSQENGKGSLEAAAGVGDVALVRMLLEEGATCSKLASLLQAAFTSGCMRLINFLLGNFAKRGLSAIDMTGGWIEYLEAATKSGSIPLLNMVLELCADTNAEHYGKYVIGAMEAAVSHNRSAALCRLLKSGVNPNADGRACRILNKAIRLAREPVFENCCFTLLMSKFAALGLDLDKPLPNDPTPLWTAVYMDDWAKAQCLILSGADINNPSLCADGTRNDHFEPPMAQAIRWDKCDHDTQMDGTCLVECLLNNGANVECLVDGSSTALLLALKLGKDKAAEALLQHGANPNTRDLETGMNAFEFALERETWPPLSMFKSLIVHGFQVDTAFNAGALIQVVAKATLNIPAACHLEISARRKMVASMASLLLAAGADVNACPTEETPMTALQYAIYVGHRDLTGILLAAGADIHAPTFWKGGKSALQAACYAGTLNLVKSLVAKGLDVNAQPASQGGATALQSAAMQGHIEVALFLLENGALINAPGSSLAGQTALHGAVEYGMLDMIYLLLENDQDDGLDERCQEAARFAEAKARFEIAQLLREYEKV